MGSQMLESQDLFATPSMPRSRNGTGLRLPSSTTGTPPQSPQRSAKRRNSILSFNGTPLVKESKSEQCYNSQPGRQKQRLFGKDDNALWSLMGYTLCSTHGNRRTEDHSNPVIAEPNGGVFLPGEGTPVHKGCERHCPVMIICCGLLLSMLLGGFLGVLCYSYLEGHYIKHSDAATNLDTTGVSLKESALGVQVNDLESSLSFLSAATQSQISQLKQSVQALTQELVTIRRTCQNMQEVQTERTPRSVYEELLGNQADLASAGNLGWVLATPDTESVKLKFLHLPGWLSFFVGTPHTPASTTIMGLIRDIGDCWGFAGERGRLVLALHKPSRLTSVSITHIATGDILSAPRHFAVLAHYSEENLEDGISLGEFEYKKQGPWRQTFILDSKIVQDELFRLIEFRFVTNHGHPGYTCVYRVHVHGV